MTGWDWEQVMPMMGRGSGPDDTRGYAALQEVRAYWEGLRSTHTLPGREQIDPRGMGGALEHVFLLERIAPGIARFRLAGMHLTLLMGLEVRGMPLTALLEPSARTAAETLIEVVFSNPAIVELTLEAERGIGRPSLEGRMLLLPVEGDDGLCDRALGCLATCGQIGRSPRRFAIARQRTEPIASWSPEAKHNPGSHLTLQPGFADPAAAFPAPKVGASPQLSRSRTHLRLVKSGD